MINKCILALLFICSAFWGRAQNAEIYGKVTTSDGQPVSRVSIVIKDTKWGAVSKDDGAYRIKNIKPGDYVVEVSLTGDVRESKPVSLSAGGHAELNFTIGETAKELNEVVVETNKIMNRASSYSSKMPLDNLENAQVVSAIPDVILRKQIAMTLEDAMKNATGVTKLWDATNRPDGGSLFVSRGFMTTTKARNGLPNIVNTNVDMANLDKIEVIKGPTGTLFGSIINSYGGLINRITKRPYFYNGGYVDVAYGSYNFMRASADANFVLQKDKMAARINVAGQNQDSWQDAGFQKSYIIAPSFVYRPNDRFTLNADAEIVGTKGNSNGGNFMFILTPSMINGPLSSMISAMYPNNKDALLAKIPQTIKEAFGTDNVKDIKVDYDRSFISNDLYSQTNTNSYFADASYKISGNWTSQTALTYSLSHNNGYAPFQYLVPNYAASFLKSAMTGNPDFGTPGADSVARMVWRPVGETKTFDVQQNFVADYTFGKVRNRAVIGVDYLSYRSDVTYYYFYGLMHGAFPFPQLYDVVGADGRSPNNLAFDKASVLNAYETRGNTEALPYNTHSNVLSGYINDVANITDYFIVSAGVRVDNFDDRVGNKVQTKFSPKFGLIFMPVKDQLSLFANYQNGFTNQFGEDRNHKTFDPEEADQKEIGIKYVLLDNKLMGTVSYYNILVKNIVRQDPADGNFSIQDGEQKSKGIEVEVLANPVNGWTLLAGYGYNDSKMQKAAEDVNGLRPVPAGPYNTANFWTNYSFTETALKGLGIGMNVNYSGESYAINSNMDGQLMLPAATILGGHLTYDLPHFRIGLKVNNITNEQYWKGWSNFIPQMPRQFIGSVAYKF
ncbi:TonB-dependent receptor [Niabella ginsenosidivorans]|uniref:TonB-dependent receptor n=1 Tax=Niabella ginsenosidivorans TaxID=1176587 RepID=A0A1A9I455_9BACT|nr:TonB-dependent receptor [Niabella ginsenosidivorans]ANH82095.1 TonB-dependent receptor [Niabella ginsenosidivorans]